MYKVLMVDDDANVLAAYKRQLRKRFNIDTAQGADKGLDAVERKGPYAVIISDLRMPGMDGIQFFSRARKISPDSIRMILTGYADLQTAIKAINEENIFQLLTKPCAPDDLAEAITFGIEQFVKNTPMAFPVKRNRSNLYAKKILIVDDDPLIRDMLSKAFEMYSDFDVLTAENGKLAMDMLSDNKIDMIITDLKMPVMNGLKLLSYINNHFLEIPVMILTGYGTPEIEAKIKKFSNFNYFEKPFDINVLVEIAYEAVAPRTLNQICGISTDVFLQMLNMEMKTCTLTVRAENQIGHLYLLKGELIAAETAKLRADEAARHIIGWNKSVIAIEHFCRIKKREIHTPLIEIIMESARAKDEIMTRTMP